MKDKMEEYQSHNFQGSYITVDSIHSPKIIYILKEAWNPDALGKCVFLPLRELKYESSMYELEKRLLRL